MVASSGQLLSLPFILAVSTYEEDTHLLGILRTRRSLEEDGLCSSATLALSGLLTLQGGIEHHIILDLV